ncbi:MAG: peptide deformylase [Bacteroidota bacterium]|jgi:peptide deformylase
MILPIVAYGDPVLRKKSENITSDYPGLETLIQNMFETMYASHGVGLAAPQIGKAINLFLVDTHPFEDEKYPNLKKVFINTEILQETGNEWEYEEGCLSIPHIRENVSRQATLTIRYQNEKFETFTETYDGIAARVIQHEYDHCMGVLFVDHLSELKKRMLKNKLTKISKGEVDVAYRMRFPAAR